MHSNIIGKLVNELESYVKGKAYISSLNMGFHISNGVNVNNIGIIENELDDVAKSEIKSKISKKVRYLDKIYQYEIGRVNVGLENLRAKGFQKTDNIYKEYKKGLKDEVIKNFCKAVDELLKGIEEELENSILSKIEEKYATSKYKCDVCKDEITGVKNMQILTIESNVGMNKCKRCYQAENVIGYYEDDEYTYYSNSFRMYSDNMVNYELSKIKGGL